MKHEDNCGETFKERCIDKLKEEGCRITQPRLTISECLEGYAKPFSVKDISNKTQ